MNRVTNWFASAVYHLVLVSFLVQTLNPLSLGYSPPVASPPPITQSSTTSPLAKLLDFLLPAANAQEAGLLASTPEADLTDRYLIDKANELGKDPQRIFAFVRDEIGFESYVGSLRGARGTLWSKAGNALDKASLMIGLLRVSGIPARYVQGTLSDADAKTLIVSMFDPVLMAQAVGFIPDEYPKADPINDTALLAETRDHWWVELGNGTQFDPSFKDNSIHGTQLTTHAEVPDNLRHKVTIRLKTEISNVLSGLSEKTPLQKTLTTAEVYGRSLTISHFIGQSGVGGLFGFGYKAFTYSPYIMIDDNNTSIENDQIIRGDNYQEFFANLLSIVNAVLTRVTLEIEVVDPGKKPQLFSRDFVDRIGIAARHGLVKVGSINAEQPILSELDHMTIQIISGLMDRSALAKHEEGFLSLAAQIDPVFQSINSLFGLPGTTPVSIEQEQAVGDFIRFFRNISFWKTRLLNSVFLQNSDSFTQDLSKSSLVKTYLDSPRIIIALDNHSTTVEEPARILGIDLRKDNAKIIAFPGQNVNAPVLFNVTRGFQENVIESETLRLFLPGGSNPVLSTLSIFAAAGEQQIDVALLLGESDIQKLEQFTISPEAKIQISDALCRGKIVNVPVKNVLLNGKESIGWYETDPISGDHIGVMEDGGHEALVEYTTLLRQEEETATTVTELETEIAKKMNPFTKEFSELARVRQLLNKIQQNIIDKGLQLSKDEIRKLAENYLKDPKAWERLVEVAKSSGSPAFKQFVIDAASEYGIPATLLGVGSIIELFGTNHELITLIQPLVVNPDGEVVTGPGISFGITPDPSFSVKVGDSQVPSAYRVQITNTGASSSFIIGGSTPAGWNLLIARKDNPIPAGVTGEISVFLQPQQGTSIPAPGTSIFFSVTAARTDNPAASLTQNVNFVTPEVSALNLQAETTTLYFTPSGNGQIVINLTNIGNITQIPSLSLELPSGITAGGIPSSLSLAPGQSTTLNLSLTSQGLPLNSEYPAKLIATFGSTGQSQTELSLKVHIAAPSALTAFNAANAATAIGRPSLGTTLESLGQALTTLAQDPTNETAGSRAIGLLNSLIEQLNVPALTPFSADLTTARDTIASGDPTPIQAALDSLSTTLSGLTNTLQSNAAALPFEVALQPNSAVALPNTPTRFGLYLKNTGDLTTTYNLSLTGIPAGVTAQLNQTSITLPAGYLTAPGVSGTNVVPDPIYVTLTQPANQLSAFEFGVVVSVAGAPQRSRTAYGAFTSREELVNVVAVQADPPFTEPGGQVAISARLLNAVNQDRNARIAYTVRDAKNTLIFQSSAQPITLTVLSSLDTFPLGTLDATGYARGSYSLAVTVTEADGSPIPGGTGQGTLLIGLPIQTALFATPPILPPGDGTVTTSLQISSQVDYSQGGIQLMGLVDTDAMAKTVAIRDQYAYVCGSTNISVVDISDPLNPNVVHTFGGGAYTYISCTLVDDKLLVNRDLNLTIYSLSNPLNPQQLGYVNAGNFGTSNTHTLKVGNFVLVNTLLYGWSSQIIFIRGDLLSFDISNPARPKSLGLLFDTPHPWWDYPTYHGSDYFIGPQADAKDGYVLLPSTSGAVAANSGNGRLLIVNTQATKPVLAGSFDIPGTRVLTGIAVQGNQALVTGSTDGFILQNNSPLLSGKLTFTLLDITHPLQPAVLGTTVTDLEVNTLTGTTVTAGSDGFYAVNPMQSGGNPVVMLVNARNPAQMTFTTLQVPTPVQDSQIVGNVLYTASDSGLASYDIGSLAGTQVTAQVRLPKGTLKPGSFNVAPDQISSTADADLLTWRRVLSATQTSQTITWDALVNDLQPGEFREIVNGGTVSFVANAVPGQIPLPPLAITSEQILALTPASRTAQRGEAVTYTVTVKNPTTAPVTYPAILILTILCQLIVVKR